MLCVQIHRRKTFDQPTRCPLFFTRSTHLLVVLEQTFYNQRRSVVRRRLQTMAKMSWERRHANRLDNFQVCDPSRSLGLQTVAWEWTSSIIELICTNKRASERSSRKQMGVRGLTLSTMKAGARSLTQKDPSPQQGYLGHPWEKRAFVDERVVEPTSEM